MSSYKLNCTPCYPKYTWRIHFSFPTIGEDWTSWLCIHVQSTKCYGGSAWESVVYCSSLRAAPTGALLSVRHLVNWIIYLLLTRSVYFVFLLIELQQRINGNGNYVRCSICQQYTKEAYPFAIYQDYPKAPDLKSIPLKFVVYLPMEKPMSLGTWLLVLQSLNLTQMAKTGPPWKQLGN